MRVTFVPPSDKLWIQHYVNQQTGRGFIGMPYQRGNGLGSLFRGLFRFILPIAKSAGHAVGKQALKTGAEIASDLVAGESLAESAKRRGRVGATNLLKQATAKLEQSGSGIGKRKKPIKGAVKPKKRKIVRDQFGVYLK